MLLCRSWGNQVLELLQKIVTSSFVELVQVIEVPKIFPDRVPQRMMERRPPQTAETVGGSADDHFLLFPVAAD